MQAEPQNTAHNVLFITVDQWRADCLGLLGHPCVRTPTLDALAADGVLFTNHWANTAPCGPSRASLLTGMYAHNHRSVSNGTPLDARFDNLAHHVRANGYDPWVLGYTDTTPDPRTTATDDPRLRTYESVMEGFSARGPITENDPQWSAFLRANGYEVPENHWALYDPAPGWRTPAGRGSSWIPTAIPAEHSETAFLTDQAIAHVQTQSAPWFLHVSYLRPHPPWRAPEGYHDLVDPADVPVPVRHRTRDAEAAQHPFLAGAMSVPAARAPDDELEQRQLAATYFGLMRHVDDELGRLIEALRATGQLDQTLVIVTSDHGEQMGDHWLIEKLGWYDASYAIPLIVRDPRAAASATRGTRVDAPTENVDLLPTISGWLGLNRPAQCDGRSLLPFLHSEAPEAWRTAVHWEYDYRLPLYPGVLGLRLNECSLVVVRTATEKYVHHGAFAPLYYDLEQDPAELHDRADDPACSERVRELAQELVTWRLRSEHDVLANTVVDGNGVHSADDRLR